MNLFYISVNDVKHLFVFSGYCQAWDYVLSNVGQFPVKVRVQKL